MTWHDRFDRLLKAMSQGEPHKAEKRVEKAAEKAAEKPKGR
jgi:hypothetical protein